MCAALHCYCPQQLAAYHCQACRYAVSPCKLVAESALSSLSLRCLGLQAGCGVRTYLGVCICPHSQGPGPTAGVVTPLADWLLPMQLLTPQWLAGMQASTVYVPCLKLHSLTRLQFCDRVAMCSCKPRKQPCSVGCSCIRLFSDLATTWAVHVLTCAVQRQGK
jgi:hypothetical protein